MDPVHRYSIGLPVLSHRQEILRHVRNNRVTVILGSTGCGKSTHIPLFLMDEMMSDPDAAGRCNILVAVPRRIAATSLCRYVCDLQGYRQGKEVGYQVGMTSAMKSEQTKILYTTTGVFVQKACQDSSRRPAEDCLGRYSHIILDEVHERSEETDFALMMVRLAKSATKVLIMSATMDVAPILDYLKDPVLFTQPPLVEIHKSLYDVKEKYLDDVCSVSPNFAFEKPYCSELIMDAVIEHIDRLDIAERSKGKKGTILIFLPGLEHIELMWDKIKEICPHHLKPGCGSLWEICPLHSLLPNYYQTMVFRDTRPFVRRIVLATNIAESSITVPGVEIVYDFCLTKRMVTDDKTQMTFLQMQWATKSNCDQRKGRAGRTQRGIVYRLVQQIFYMNSFTVHSVPEILSLPPTATIIRLKIMKFKQSPAVILGASLSPPDAREIQRAVLILKEKGALSLYHQGELKSTDGDLTFLGRLCFALPFSLSLCRLVYLAFTFGMVDDGIVIACLISRNIFSSGLNQQNDSYLSRKKFDGGMRSDCLASFRAFREWMLKNVKNEFPKDNEDESLETMWCRSRSLSLIRMREVQNMVAEIRSRLYSLGLCETNNKYFQNPFDPDGTWELLIKVLMAGAFYPDYIISSANALCTDTLDSLAAAASVNSTRFGGFDPTRTVHVSVPGVMSHFLPVFYDEQLRLWIRDKLKTDENPSILYHGNSAAVTFEPTVDDVSGSTLMTVELLIRESKRNKFGRRQTPFSFSTVDQGSGDHLLSAMPELVPYTKMRYEDLPWFELERASVHPEFPSPTLPDISPGDVVMDLVISNAFAPCSFFGRIYDIGDPDPLIAVECEITRLRLDSNNLLSVPSAFKGMAGRCVLSPCENSSSGFARARVLRTYSSDLLEVYLVDYGITSRVRLASVLLVSSANLDRLFWTEPALAVECILPYYIKFAGSVDKNRGQIFPTNIPLTCSVLRYDKKTFVLCDVREANPQGIHVSLVALAHKRGLLSIDPSVVAPVIGEDIKTVKIPSGNIVPHFLPQGQKLPFGGAGSLYEISHSGGYTWTYEVKRPVQIHTESINTVLIQKQKPDPISHVLIAHEALVSKNKNAVVISQSTLMPHTPAMAAMLSCIFAPVVEIRLDPISKRPVAFFCGLGAAADPETDMPIAMFPSHDFVLSSDGVMDKDDVFAIDHLRRGFNMVAVEANEFLLSEHTDEEKQAYVEKVSSDQHGLKEILLSLFNRIRGVVVNPLAKYPDTVGARRWTSSMAANITLPESLDDRRQLLNRITYEMFWEFDEDSVITVQDTMVVTEVDAVSDDDETDVYYTVTDDEAADEIVAKWAQNVRVQSVITHDDDAESFMTCI